MLDCDIARLYQVNIKRINEAVKNKFFKILEEFHGRFIIIDIDCFLMVLHLKILEKNVL